VLLFAGGLERQASLPTGAFVICARTDLANACADPPPPSGDGGVGGLRCGRCDAWRTNARTGASCQCRKGRGGQADQRLAERLVWKQGPSPRRAREDRQEQRAAFNPTANGMLECPLQAPRARLSPAKGEASVADISRHEYIDVALILHRGDVRPAAGVSS
jgi:hypothetical protein